MILRARCILPLGDSPIDNGALVVKEGRIDWLGPWRSLENREDKDIRDLGEVVLMPGLINAHAHLDYTSMAGQIPPPRNFPEWVMTMLSYKAHWSFSEFAESWLKGSRMLLSSGTTTVADVETVPELLSQVWEATPLRVISFLEMTGVKSQRSPREVLGDALKQISELPKVARKEAALSPHALYSTQPELIRLCAKTEHLLTTHLSESESEYQMFKDSKGPFYDWLKGQRKMDDCRGVSPVQLADEYGLLSPRLLAIHVNYLAPGDADLLGRKGVNVVHCPRSHDYFAHDPFCYDELVKAGVNICLGTDSLASTRKFCDALPELNMWYEMRNFERAHPGVAPREIVRLATVNGARALRKENEIGQLKRGFAADCISAGYTGPIQEARIYEELVHAASVRDVVIGGDLVKQG